MQDQRYSHNFGPSHLFSLRDSPKGLFKAIEIWHAARETADLADGSTVFIEDYSYLRADLMVVTVGFMIKNIEIKTSAANWSFEGI